MNLRTARDLLDAYAVRHPEERRSLDRLQTFFAKHAPEAWADRRTPAGHLTASGVVLDPSRAHVLLVHHKALDRWLQPGGHIEPTDASLHAAALREVVEETGLDESDLRLVGLPGEFGPLPIDIDSHDIPARPSKGEGPHVHHDFRYAFEYVGDGDAFTLQASEVHAARWWPIDGLPQPNDLEAMVRKAVGAGSRSASLGDD